MQFKSKKGIALALDTVVLLILAAVVLGALLAFLVGAIPPTQRDLRKVEICKDTFAADARCSSDKAKEVS
jgi:hypothetical protein